MRIQPHLNSKKFAHRPIYPTTTADPVLLFRVRASFLKNLNISYEIAIIWMLVE